MERGTRGISPIRILAAGVYFLGSQDGRHGHVPQHSRKGWQGDSVDCRLCEYGRADWRCSERIAQRTADERTQDDAPGRVQQGDLSGARQRSRAAAIQRADRAHVAAQQRADEREAEEFAKRAQPSQRPPEARPPGPSSKSDKKSTTNGAGSESAGEKKRGEAATETELPIPRDDKTK